MRIKVDPDRLRSAAQQLSSTSSELQNLSSRLGGAMGELDWEARRTAGVDGDVARVRSLANDLANRAGRLAAYLNSKARTFEDADRQGVANAQVVNGMFSDWRRQWMQSGFQARMAYPADEVQRQLGLGTVTGSAGPASVPVAIPGQDEVSDPMGSALSRFNDVASSHWFDLFKGLTAASLLTYVARNGNIIIYGARGAKEAAGLSPYLNIIGTSNLPAHMAEQGLPHLSRSFLAGSFVSAAFEWWKHRDNYQSRQGANFFAAVTVDGVIGATKGFAAQSLGAWAGAFIAGAVVGAVGLTVAAPAVAAGAIMVGGVVGAVTLGWILDKGFEALDNRFQVRDKAIGAVTTAYNYVGQQVSSAYRAATQTARNAAANVDSTLRKAASAVTGLVGGIFGSQPSFAG
jgi:uncharacterized protein YukE